jgi:hypothetical protein
MSFPILDDEGKALDARFELGDDSTIIFHSRGGAKEQNPRNSQYEAGLRVLIERLTASKTPIDSVMVDSSAARALPVADRTILTKSEADLPAEKICQLLATRMKAVGQVPGTTGGNSTKKIRIQLGGIYSGKELMARIGVQSARLPVGELTKVTAEDLHYATNALLTCAQHPFGPSTDYDVLLDTGERLPPKAVFGLAATRALGFEVLPGHFTGGIGSPCFRALEAAGYKILEKDTAAPPLPPDAEDVEWAEGNEKLRAHMKKERGSGLAAAKRKEFRRVHGRLFCERCKMDPVTTFGDPAGEACIEVHHAVVQVQEMAAGHRTKLSDLQCLCANCHRVEHRRLAAAQSNSVANAATALGQVAK